MIAFVTSTVVLTDENDDDGSVAFITRTSDPVDACMPTTYTLPDDDRNGGAKLTAFISELNEVGKATYATRYGFPSAMMVSFGNMAFQSASDLLLKLNGGFGLANSVTKWQIGTL